MGNVPVGSRTVITEMPYPCGLRDGDGIMALDSAVAHGLGSMISH